MLESVKNNNEYQRFTIVQMKKIFIILLFCVSSISFAQDAVYLHCNTGLNLAYPQAPHNKVWGVSYNLGIGLGYNISESFSTEVLYQYTKHKLDTFNRDSGEAVYDYTNSFLIKGNYILSSDGFLQPFVSLGIGISKLELSKEVSNNVLSLFPGFGLRYRFMNDFELKLFAEYAFVNKEYFPGDYLKYFPVQIGFQYYL